MPREVGIRAVELERFVAKLLRDQQIRVGSRSLGSKPERKVGLAPQEIALLVRNHQLDADARVPLAHFGECVGVEEERDRKQLCGRLEG